MGVDCTTETATAMRRETARPERRGGSSSGLPARPFVTALMILAILMVLASLIH